MWLPVHHAQLRLGLGRQQRRDAAGAAADAERAAHLDADASVPLPPGAQQAGDQRSDVQAARGDGDGDETGGDRVADSAQGSQRHAHARGQDSG